MPASLRNALGIAIYSMFAAIIIPPARENPAVAFCIALSSLISCFLYYTPPFSNIVPGGFAIIICAVLSAALISKLVPVKEDEATGDE